MSSRSVKRAPRVSWINMISLHDRSSSHWASSSIGGLNYRHKYLQGTRIRTLTPERSPMTKKSQNTSNVAVSEPVSGIQADRHSEQKKLKVKNERMLTSTSSGSLVIGLVSNHATVAPTASLSLTNTDIVDKSFFPGTARNQPDAPRPDLRFPSNTTRP